MTNTAAASMRASLAAVAMLGLFTAPVLAGDFTGAGATFPAPVYAAWSADYTAGTGNALNYQAIGSGGGQTQILNRTVDFGASNPGRTFRDSGNIGDPSRKSRSAQASLCGTADLPL